MFQAAWRSSCRSTGVRAVAVERPAVEEVMVALQAAVLQAAVLQAEAGAAAHQDRRHRAAEQGQLGDAEQPPAAEGFRRIPTA